VTSRSQPERGVAPRRLAAGPRLSLFLPSDLR
jgi:hypothetical protein